MGTLNLTTYLSSNKISFRFTINFPTNLIKNISEKEVLDGNRCSLGSYIFNIHVEISQLTIILSLLPLFHFSFFFGTPTETTKAIHLNITYGVACTKGVVRNFSFILLSEKKERNFFFFSKWTPNLRFRKKRMTLYL